MSPLALRLGSRPLVACLVLVCAACGSKPSPPQGPGESITGRERLGWDQAASSSFTLSTFQYALYVNGARRVLTGVTCDPVPRAEGFGCSAPLPPLTPGTYTIELAAFTNASGTVMESPRSPAFRVTVAAAALPSASRIAEPPEPVTTIDGVRLAPEVILDGLTAPVDFAQAGDGRFFVGERAGHVRIARLPDATLGTALSPDGLGTEPGGELLALALHPDFGRNGFVFVAFTAGTGSGGYAFHVARFREVGGRLGERAVLLDGIPASAAASAVLRFGPDTKLYVAVDDGGVPADAGSLGSFNGKVLRLTDGGALPDDNPLPSLVYSLGHRSPRGLDWQPRARTLWVVDRDAGERDVLMRVAPGKAPGDGRWQLSADLQPGAAGAAFYTGGDVPEWRGDLFVAAADGAHLIRVRFDDHEPASPVSAERLLLNRFGHLRQVVMGADGAIYFSTLNPHATGTGGDVLVRLAAVLSR